MNARRILLELFDAALRAVDGRALRREISRRRAARGPIEVFAIGKAASAMALGRARCARRRASTATLVITKDGHADPELDAQPRVTIIESAHPVPDARSLAAGARARARGCGAARRRHAAVSRLGRRSSLVELLRDDATLEDLRALNQRGLAAGWDIAALNTERARLSQLKAGGVARMLAGRRAMALFISDVPGDDPDVIGSGILGHDDGRRMRSSATSSPMWSWQFTPWSKRRSAWHRALARCRASRRRRGRIG